MVEHAVVTVSPEMVAIIGPPPVAVALPAAPCATLLVALDCPVSVRIFADAAAGEWRASCGERTIALIVVHDALVRLFDWLPVAGEVPRELGPDAARGPRDHDRRLALAPHRLRHRHRRPAPVHRLLVAARAYL